MLIPVAAASGQGAVLAMLIGVDVGPNLTYLLVVEGAAEYLVAVLIGNADGATACSLAAVRGNTRSRGVPLADDLTDVRCRSGAVAGGAAAAG